MQTGKTEVALGTQNTRRLAEDARAALADKANQSAPGASGWFPVTPESDRDLRERERIRHEIARAIFSPDTDAARTARLPLARRLAKLLRLG